MLIALSFVLPETGFCVRGKDDIFSHQLLGICAPSWIVGSRCRGVTLTQVSGRGQASVVVIQDEKGR